MIHKGCYTEGLVESAIYAGEYLATVRSERSNGLWTSSVTFHDPNGDTRGSIFSWEDSGLELEVLRFCYNGTAMEMPLRHLQLAVKTSTLLKEMCTQYSRPVIN